MNIAIFASAFYPSLGGVEELVRQLAHVYKKEGLKPIVLTNRWPRSLPRYEEYEGIPVYRLAMRTPEGSLKARVNHRLTHQGIVREMLGILRIARTDILHIQCVSSNGYYALLAKHALSLPLIVTTQGERTMDADHIYQKSPFLNQTLSKLLAEADYITACSQNTLSDIEDYFGRLLGSRASVVYNGINLDDYNHVSAYSHPKPYILGIGRMVKQKGFDVLIEAFAKANLDTHDLLLAGDGVERRSLEQLVEAIGLQNQVKFLGRADRPLALSLFQGCDFFVLPSRHEPQGIVNLEAMASGKAVIAAKVGGVPEIVQDNCTGLLIPDNDVNALSQAISRLVGNTQLKNALAHEGQKRAQLFSWSVIANEYLAIYNSVGTKCI